MLFDLSDGKNSVLLKANAWINHPRWSPSGDVIAFVLSPSGRSELHSIRPDGSEHRKIIAAEEQGIDSIFNPAWASDGRSIYFQDMTNLIEVTVGGRVRSKTPVGAITGEGEAVTSSDAFVPSPANTKLLAFTRSVPGTPLFERTFGEPNTALFIYDLQTRTRKRITPVEMLALDPIWSRDGRFIYFSGYRDREGRAASPFKIYRIAPDGTGLTQIAAGETPG
jgi:Tol biopolymer transport system component